MWTGIAIVLIVLGGLIGVVGWILNTQTPIQQPLPVVGGVMVLVGIVALLVIY